MKMKFFEKIRRATKRKNILYRAKKDGTLRHWIVNKQLGYTNNGNLMMEVFDVNSKKRPNNKAPKFRELIPSRIEKTFYR